MRGKRKLRITPRAKKDWDEILRVTLGQRYRDTNGDKLPGFTWEEVFEMTAEQREALKSGGWLKLPSLMLPHAPTKYGVDKITYCPCTGCQDAIAD